MTITDNVDDISLVKKFTNENFLYFGTISAPTLRRSSLLDLGRILINIITPKNTRKHIDLYSVFRSFLNKSQPYSLALELYHFLLNIFRQKLWHHQEFVL